MAKLQVGQKVYVSNPDICLNGCNDTMRRLVGKLATITQYFNDRHIRIDLDDGNWNWSANCFTVGVPTDNMTAEQLVKEINSPELTELWEQRKKIESKINKMVMEYHIKIAEKEKVE